MLMYGTWAALWDGLRRPEARACARLAGRHGRVSQEAVWTHVAELTLLQVRGFAGSGGGEREGC